jgi:hypothetical protein
MSRWPSDAEKRIALAEVDLDFCRVMLDLMSGDDDYGGRCRLIEMSYAAARVKLEYEYPSK